MGTSFEIIIKTRANLKNRLRNWDPEFKQNKSSEQKASPFGPEMHSHSKHQTLQCFLQSKMLARLNANGKWGTFNMIKIVTFIKDYGYSQHYL